jgi:hypothetical protein
MHRLISNFEVERPFRLASTQRAQGIQGISEYAEGVPSWSITDHAGSLGNFHADQARRTSEQRGTSRRLLVLSFCNTVSRAHFSCMQEESGGRG